MIGKTETVIESHEWDKLVQDTYQRPYCFQQQDGCQSRGIVPFTVPDEEYDAEQNDTIPEHLEHEVMGVKFEVWKARDPKKKIDNEPDYVNTLWWERNFYPDFQTVANDLHKRGLLEAGDYLINIDW